ncbi:hypothetical protein N7523_007930 [Penicillium sp. IBT 18751x]|nr:hypothetical protein N7523_007930 [Penicillium sp. IBT 18751x]
MIQITQDSEFMTNLLAANPVPAGKHFAVIQDQNSNPAVFSLGEDSKLNLIINQNGAPTLVDYGALCQITKDVQAFSVQQSSVDQSIFITVVADAGQNQSAMYILVNMTPQNLLSPSPSNIIAVGNLFPQVYDVFLSDFSTSVGNMKFPLMCLSMAPAGAITKMSQLGQLDVSQNPDGSLSFSLDTSWRLPTDPIEIMCLSFGQCPVGAGVFILYTASDGTHIQFRTLGDDPFASDSLAPAGALCIDSYVNPTTTFSELAVGGDVITNFDYHQYCVPNSPGTPVVTGDSSLGMTDIHVAQADNNITFWYTTAANGVHYYSAPLSALNTGQLIQLLDDGEGGRISTMMAAQEAGGSLLVDTLVSADQTGMLTLLQCASDTGMWQAVPFFAPSATNNIEVPSFTLRFTAATDDSTQPVQNCQLHIVASGAVAAISNGARTTIDQEGRWYQADTVGAVSIIVSSSDMASFTFQVDQFQAQGQPAVSLQSLVLNPNAKMNAKLATITSGNDLLKAKTQSGQLLIDTGTVSQDDANTAAQVLTELNKSQILLGAPSYTLRKLTSERKFYNPQGITPVILCGRLPDTAEATAHLIKSLSVSSWYDPWGVWSWIKDKAKQATSYIVTVVGKAVSFAVTLAGQVYKFVLDSVEAVGKAITWVFDKIKVGLEKLIDFLGFIFNWGDILTTADSIVAVVNAALDYGTDQIPALKALESSWLDSLRNAMGQQTAPVPTAAGSEMKDPEETSTMDQTKNSVSLNWTAYQASYGGLATNSSVGLTATSAPAAAASSLGSVAAPQDVTLHDLWNDMNQIFSTVEHDFVDLGQDVANLFNPNTKSTDVYNQISNQILTTAIDTVQNVTDLALDALSLALTQLRAHGNKPIQIPIFSFLWKQISGGRDFTVFNAFALLLAAPTTVIYKLVVGRAPPDLRSIDKATFAAYVNGTLGDDEKSLAITRTQILELLGWGSLFALQLEMYFQALSTLAKAKDETIDSMVMCFSMVVVIKGWPVAGQKDMSYRRMVWFLDLGNLVVFSTSNLVGWKFGIPRTSRAPIVSVCAGLTAVPSFILKILYNTDAESGGVLARHITEDALGMIRAWLSAIKECATDPRIMQTAQKASYVCMGLQFVLMFVDLYLEAPINVLGSGDGSMKLRLSAATTRMPPANMRHMLKRE